MKLGINLVFERPEVVIEKAVLADRYGFDWVTLVDHLSTMAADKDWCWDGPTMLSYFAAKTRKVRLGTAVTDPYRRHPAVLAQIFATIDQISKGRAVIGLGAGEAQNLTPYGIPFEKPVSKLKEAIQVIDLLLRSSHRKPVTYNGQFFRMENAFLQIPCVQKPRVPIFVGSLGAKSRELIGEMADGLMSWIATPTILAERLKDVRRGEERAGRRPGSVKTAVIVPTCVSKKIEEARRAVDVQCRTALLLERNVLKSWGYEVPLPPGVDIIYGVPTADKVKEFYRAMKTMPEEAVDRCKEEYAVIGTPEKVIEGLKRFEKAGADYVLLQVFGEFKDTMKAYGKEIIPAMD